MVPADSQQIPRARCYSGTLRRTGIEVFAYGALTVYGRPSQATSTNTTALSLLAPGRRTREEHAPQHRTHNPRRVSHAYGLAILRFRSPLLTESQLFSLPTGTEMFHFPAFPPHPMYSGTGDTTSLVPGFPIRTSSDPRSVDNSPRHIAASHVLHRLPVPRHPPCALKHLQHKNQKMSHPHTPNRRMQASQKLHIRHHTNPPPTTGGEPHMRCLDARNHYPQIKHHTPPPKRGDNNQRSHPASSTTSGFPHSGRRDDGPVVSKPNSVSGNPSPQHPTELESRTGSTFVVHPNPTHYRHGPSTNRSRTPNSHHVGGPQVSWCSLERR